MPKTKVTIGGIVRHSEGYGFKITFPTQEDAQHYKDMIYYVLKTEDHLDVFKDIGYFDEEAH